MLGVDECHADRWAAVKRALGSGASGATLGTLLHVLATSHSGSRTTPPLMPYAPYVRRSRWTVAGRGAALVAVSIGLGILTVYVGTRTHPNTFATLLLQAITLVFSTYGAYVFAKASVEDAARALVTPHARSAFRRVRSIYEALGRLLDLIDRQSVNFNVARKPSVPDTLDYETVRLTMLMLERIITEQVSTVDDALDDWRDLVPDEVQQIEDQARRRRNDRDGG